MKKTILASLLFLISAVFCFSKDDIKLTFFKNSFGELILTIEGHTKPVIVRVGDNTVTLYVEENKVNLTAAGINELTDISVEEVDTAGGSDQSSVDNQILPVTSNFNPPLTTPY